MLTALRRAAGSFVAKILFVLLIVSFAVWGIGDIFRGFSRDVPVATVAGQQIGLDEALLEFRREMSALTRQFGGRFEPTEPIRRAIAEQVANRLAAGRAIDAEAARMGLAVGDEALRQAVFGLPAFAGPDGRFSQLVFQNFLRNQGVSEPQFLAIVRADIARQALLTAVRGGAAAPPSLTRALAAYAGETRIAEIAAIEAATLPDPPPPDEAALRRWYDTHPEDFSSPEYRDILVAVLGPDQLAPNITVSDDEVAAAFAARRAELEQPERRDADQLQFSDEATAGIVAAQWRVGADWATIAARTTEAGGTANRLGLVTRASLPIPALAEAIFTAPGVGIAGPVRTPFGWTVLRINRIEPGRTMTLEEAAPQLRAAIQRERAADQIYANERRVEDALAGGAPLETVAREHGMALFRASAVDAEGRDRDGLAVDLGPVGQAALSAAFAASPGAEPRMIEAAGAVFFAVQVLAVTPAAPKPFETVREAVARAVADDLRARAAEEAATALMSAARAEGASLATAAAAAGITVGRTEPIRRPDPRQPQAAPAELVRAVFALPAAGETTMVRTPAGFAVVSLAEIIPAQIEEAALAQLRIQASQALGEDLEQGFVDTLRTRANATINPRGIELLAQP
jgi:peptidyl-prolyl cis-trans isomerase D